MSKWALVTGATAGIGESFTRMLASKGFDIALVARDETRLHERAAALREKFGVQTFVLPADLATDQGCSAVEDYLSEFEVEVLINNAGFGINKSFTASALDAEQSLLDVLVRTPMRLMHVVMPQMKARNSGTVINVSSVASFIAGGTYSASKSYLTVLSESLHTELRGTQIKINALCPGFTRTEFHERGRMRMKGLPDFMWLNSDYLVAQSWADAEKGKAISIPGWQYKLIFGFIALLPRPMARSIGMNLRRRQR